MEQEGLQGTEGNLSDLSVVRAGGLWNAIYESSGKMGMTLGNTINLPPSMVADPVGTNMYLTLKHELVHVWQYQSLGVRYLVSYIANHFASGYDSNFFETQARSIERMPDAR